MRLIDADALSKQVHYSMEDDPYSNSPACGPLSRVYNISHKHILRIIDEASTIGAEPVVRCRDCAYYRPEPYGDVLMCYGFANGHFTHPDDYCSRGKRKEVEE